MDTSKIGSGAEMFITTKTFERKEIPFPGMSPVGVVSFGEVGRINALLSARPQIFREMGIVGALNYLIEEQMKISPEYVGGDIAVLQIDSKGTRWIQNAACEDKASRQPTPKPVNPN